jgi:hypothetical protein
MRTFCRTSNDPGDKALCIAFWQQGLNPAEIARRLDMPRGPVSSHARLLIVQGKIEPHPKAALVT